MAQYAYFFPLWEERGVCVLEKAARWRECAARTEEVDLGVSMWKRAGGFRGGGYCAKSVRHSPRFPRAAEVIIRKLPKYGL